MDVHYIKRYEIFVNPVLGLRLKVNSMQESFNVKYLISENIRQVYNYPFHRENPRNL